MWKTRLHQRACRYLLLGILLLGLLAPSGQLLASPADLPAGGNLIEWILDWWSGGSAPEAVTGASETFPTADPNGPALAPGIDSGETTTTTTETGTEGDALPTADPNG